MLEVDPHPLLHPGAFTTHFPVPLGASPSPTWLTALLVDPPGAVEVPLARSEEIRAAVRDLLRHGGYKPTGRGKPASEYLVRAAVDGKLSPINLAVDACNVVSLHSGLPISVVDLDRVVPPLRVGLAPEECSYVFNASDQEIRLDHLLCLFDAEGPCANAVKDSQRTKTSDTTRSTFSVVWGTRDHAEHTGAAVRWYRELLERAGAETRDV